MRDYCTGVLIGQFYKNEQCAPGQQVRHDAIATLQAKAYYDGVEEQVFTRVGEQNSRLYVDLCDKQWRVVEIDARGWRIRDDSPVRFLRRRGMMPLPEPTRGGSLDELRPFLNVKGGEEDFLLVTAWLVAVLRPKGPYPVLVFQGEQGTAKSTAARMLRALIDPSTSSLRTIPHGERDLLIAARNSWVVSYDNLSGLKGWLSDALCRLSTGGGLSTRKLYTDDDEILIDVQRPVVLNGIDTGGAKQDLVDRSLFIELQPIPESQRRTEAALWADFEAVTPRLLGTLLDKASTAIQNLPGVHLDSLPRMADFACLAVAAFPGKQDLFLSAYQQNRKSSVEAALEDSVVAQAVRRLMQDHSEWVGTATKLLSDLAELVPQENRKPSVWPQRPNTLSKQLRRDAPALRSIDIDVEFKHSTTRLIHIRTISSSLPSGSSDTRKNGDSVDQSADDADGPRTIPTTQPSAQGARLYAASDDTDGSDADGGQETKAWCNARCVDCDHWSRDGGCAVGLDASDPFVDRRCGRFAAKEDTDQPAEVASLVEDGPFGEYDPDVDG